MNEPALVSIALTPGDPSAPGQSAPVSVSVRNVSPQTIWLVGVVDGAQAGVRYPKWIAHVVGPNGLLPPPEAPDFTSPLRPADFRRLAPEEAFDPTLGAGRAGFFPLAAFHRIAEEKGNYVVSLELDTDAPDAAAWEGTLPDRRPQAEADRREVVRLLQKVPRLRVRSNVLHISSSGEER